MRVSARHDTTVVMVGDTKVGKSALVNTFRTGKFESGYNKTNFESFNTSSTVSGQRVKFTIYDTSGLFQYILMNSCALVSLVVDQSLFRIDLFQDFKVSTCPESWRIARLTCSWSATR